MNNSSGGVSSPKKSSTSIPCGSGSGGNKSASLTVINELPEAEAITSTAECRRSKLSESESGDEDNNEEDQPPAPPPPPPMGIFGDARPTLLGPADLRRLQRKHEKALRRANEKAAHAAAEAKKRRKLRKQRKLLAGSSKPKNSKYNSGREENGIEEGVDRDFDDEDDESSSIRRQFPKASTCKSALVSIYYTTTIVSAVSAAALIFVGLQYQIKGALIAGTLLAFSAFGLCTNHCFSQSLGVARQLTPQEAAAANEERRVLERSLSLVPQSYQQQPASQAADESAAIGERKKSMTPSVAPTSESQQQRAPVVSAVDSMLARRLSTLAVFPDPAARLMMRQQQLHHPQQLHQRRRSSMLHLARSMSLAAAAQHADPGWIGHSAAGLEDYTEFV